MVQRPNVIESLQWQAHVPASYVSQCSCPAQQQMALAAACTPHRFAPPPPHRPSLFVHHFSGVCMLALTLCSLGELLSTPVSWPPVLFFNILRGRLVEDVLYPYQRRITRLKYINRFFSHFLPDASNVDAARLCSSSARKTTCHFVSRSPNPTLSIAKV